MNRITERDLERQAGILNEITSSNPRPWDEPVKGRTSSAANIGNFHISFQYGGVSLHRMMNEGGGVRDIFGCGHVSKRDLFNRIRAYIAGLESQRVA